MQYPRKTVGIAAVALSAVALMGFGYSARTAAKSMKGMSMGQKVQLCLDQRAEDGYYRKPVNRETRRIAQANFRACIRAAAHGHKFSRSSRSSASTSRSSASSVSTSSITSASNMSSASSVSSGMSQSSASSASSVRTLRQVSIEDFAYSPSTLVVKKGTTVRWTNGDDAPHTVTTARSGGPNSGTLNEGDTYEFTFTQAGTYHYYCAIHPDMRAKVIVTE